MIGDIPDGPERERVLEALRRDTCPDCGAVGFATVRAAALVSTSSVGIVAPVSMWRCRARSCSCSGSEAE